MGLFEKKAARYTDLYATKDEEERRAQIVNDGIVDALGGRFQPGVVEKKLMGLKLCGQFFPASESPRGYWPHR